MGFADKMIDPQGNKSGKKTKNKKHILNSGS